MRFSGTDRSVIKGPFFETSELHAGNWIWQLDPLSWVTRCQNTHNEACEIEIRPVVDMEDFGDAMTRPPGRNDRMSMTTMIAHCLWFDGPDPDIVNRVITTIMTMTRTDIVELEAAARGGH